MSTRAPNKTSERSDNAIQNSPTQKEDNDKRPKYFLNFLCLLRNAETNNDALQQTKKEKAPNMTQERKGGIRSLTIAGIAGS